MVERKKPVKLEWQGGIVQEVASDAAKVLLKSSQQKANKSIVTETQVPEWIGAVKARKETKGRGGKAVTVLFDFVPNISESQLRLLSSSLKEKLACGGGVDEGVCILQTVQKDLLIQALAKKNCKVVFAGGF